MKNDFVPKGIYSLKFNALGSNPNFSFLVLLSFLTKISQNENPFLTKPVRNLKRQGSNLTQFEKKSSPIFQPLSIKTSLSIKRFNDICCLKPKEPGSIPVLSKFSIARSSFPVPSKNQHFHSKPSSCSQRYTLDCSNYGLFRQLKRFFK